MPVKRERGEEWGEELYTKNKKVNETVTFHFSLACNSSEFQLVFAVRI